MAAETDRSSSALLSEPSRRRRLIGLAAAISILAGAAGAGGMFGALRLTGALDRPQAVQTQISTMPLPDVPEMLAALRPSIVSIDITSVAVGSDGTPTISRGAGTGFVITASGMIATNAHVVAGTSSVQVTFADGATLPAAIVGIDRPDDLAVVNVQRSGLIPVRLGTSADLRVGEMVVAIGNALALEGGPTASLGIVSALGRTIEVEGTTYTDLVQTDAAINSGDSGGPLVDAEGRVIGVNTAAASSAESIGFAISIDRAAPVLRQLSAAA
jgi:serine protease Do